MDGWYMDEKCLARQTQIKGSSLPLEGIKHFHDIPGAIDAVKAGTVSQGHRLKVKVIGQGSNKAHFRWTE